MLTKPATICAAGDRGDIYDLFFYLHLQCHFSLYAHQGLGLAYLI